VRCEPRRRCRIQHQALFDGDAHSFLVHKEERRVVHSQVQTYPLEEADDVSPGLELRQGAAVALARLRQGGAHMTQDCAVMPVAVIAGRAAAEHLGRSEELLMNLEPGGQSHGFRLGLPVEMSAQNVRTHAGTRQANRSVGI